MRLRLLIKTLIFILACAGASPIFFSGELPPWASVAVPVIIFLSWFSDRYFTDRFVRVINYITLLFMVMQIARGILGVPLTILALEFALAVLLNRMLNRKDARHYQQIIALSFVNLLGGTLLVEEMFYFLCFMMFVFLVPPLAALVHLWVEVESRLGSANRNPDAHRILASQRIASAKYVLGTASLGFPIILLIILIFIFYPRLGLGIWAKRGQSGLRLIGFSNEVNLDFWGELVEDTSSVIRYRFIPPLELPENADLPRFRGTVFDFYNGKKWKRTDNLRRPWIIKGGRFSWGRRRRTADSRLMEIFLESTDPPILFIPQGASSIAFESTWHRGRAALYRSIEIDRYGSVYLLNTTPLGISYQAEITGEGPPVFDPEPRKSDLMLPAGMERTATFFREVTAGENTDRGKAMAVLGKLRSSYKYILKIPKERESDDPLEDFLFYRRSGHCELFATAMAVGLRVVGIPSRLVTGFSSAVYNDVGEYYQVQQRHAHAWVEAYIKGRGWVVFDPTPQISSAGFRFRPGNWANQLLDMLRVRWQIWVVGFNLRRQFEIARYLRSAYLKLRRSRADKTLVFAATEENDDGRGNTGRFVLVGLLIAVVIAVSGAFLLHRRYKITGERRFFGVKRASEKDITRIFRKMENLLRRQGFPRPAGMTAGEYADFLAEKNPVFGDLPHAVVKFYYNIRFGGEVLDTVAQREINRIVNKLVTLGRKQNRKRT